MPDELHHLSFTDPRTIAIACGGLAFILCIWWVMDALERERKNGR